MTGTSELRTAARGGALTLVGAATSAGLGFVLIVVMARLLGPAGSGVVLQTIAAFTIALSVARLGLDTTAMWLLPRVLHEDPRRVPAALTALLVPAVLVPLLPALAWFVTAAIVDGPLVSSAVDQALGAVVLFLPAASLMGVTLAVSRAFGDFVPFTLIGSISLPALRIAAIGATVALGGSAVAAATAWAVPWMLGMLAALLVLWRRSARVLPAVQGRRSWRPDRHLVGRVLTFSLPRALSSFVEQSNVWLAVLLVGMLAGAVEAGQYGTAARFVSGGLIVMTALRLAVAPRFSALLAQQRNDQVHELYTVTARWVLLFGAPIYILLAVNAPTVLAFLGSGFAPAVPSVVVLCLGSILMLAFGNVQSLLLMSGGSAKAAVNKVAALAVTVTATVLLVPAIGIIGAAISAVAGSLLDTVLAAVQVRRSTGIALDPLKLLAVVGVTAVCAGLPALVAVATLGQGLPALAVSVAGTAALVLLTCRLGRRPLHVSDLTSILKRPQQSETRAVPVPASGRT